MLCLLVSCPAVTLHAGYRPAGSMLPADQLISQMVCWMGTQQLMVTRAVGGPPLGSTSLKPNKQRAEQTELLALNDDYCT